MVSHNGDPMPLQQEWLVARLSELRARSTLGFTTGTDDWPFRGLLVWHNDKVHAYANTCPHQGHPLNYEADRFLAPDGRQLICASHGALFEPATGLCTRGPCTGARLVSLPVRVTDDCIWVTAPASQRDFRAR